MAFASLGDRRFSRSPADETRVAVEQRSVVFKLAPSLLKRLGWAAGSKIDVLLGDGPDTGTAMLSADTKKGWSLRPEGSDTRGLAIKVGRVHFPGPPPVTSSTRVRTELRDQNMLVWLPWADAEEIPERATAVEPKRKPPEADGRAVDGAGGFSEAGPAERGSGSATSLFRTPGDTDKAGRAGEAGGSPATTRFGPPTPRAAFPVQQRTVADADRKKASERRPLTGWKRMSLAQTLRFIAACATDRPWAELKGIVAEPPGNYSHGNVSLARRDLAEEIADKKRQLAASEPEGLPLIPDSVLEFLRVNVVPVLAPLGKKVTKNRDGTGLLLDGHPVTLERVVEETNRILGEFGEGEQLVVPAAAA